MSSQRNQPDYGLEVSEDVWPEPYGQQETDQLVDLIQEITQLFQQDYILLATFLRALTR